jgi:ABC-2 type transport system permease protein
MEPRVAEQTVRPAGSIYDLGYRQFEGERLGRRHAISALYVHSLRGIFGLSRSAINKVFPIGLACLALTPAIVRLAIAAFAPENFEFVAPPDVYVWISIIVALFCAVAAPDLVGRDQRNHTLPLYFSRAITRSDYISAKILALFVAVLGVMLLPQALLFLGNAVATEDMLNYLGDEIDQVPPVIASSVVVALVVASLSLALASLSSKRALSTGIVFAFFVLATVLSGALFEATTGDIRNYVLLISPLDALEGVVFWIFGATPPDDRVIAEIDVDGPVYFLAAAGYIAVSLAFLYRRFERMSV